MAENDRLRSPLKPDYAEALGRAAFTFATCEWQVAWCLEKIKPGSLGKVVGEELTAGKIAKRFIDACRSMPKSKEREALIAISLRFSDLVEERNRILHGKPCTGPNGEPRLSGPTVIEIADLDDAADEFVDCSGQLNAAFYGFLSTYTPRLHP